MPIDTPLHLFEYLDYRKFLGDFFRRKRSLNKGFSYRLFCRKANINSPGFISEVVGGTRNLSKACVEKFAVALGLDAKEKSYFELMVAFTHAKTDEAKQSLYALMVKAMPLQIQGLRRSQWDYFSKWYHVAVRETLSILEVKDDYAALANRLNPAITPAQAKSAVALLRELGLIERDPKGFWKARHVSLVTKGDDSESLLFRAFRKEMLAKAAEALDRFPAKAQNSSCITLSISPEGMARVLAHLEEFHQRVIETVQADRGEDRVVQINMQVFPLTGIEEAHAPSV
ncbi:MAG: hypothetical protein JWO30_4143 [Fibrobacteres bacterium]|nr:hypothetical protein [Fibrobacterota bacterium]